MLAIEHDLESRQVLNRIGVAAKKDADEAVGGDVSDRSMSGWWRGRPIQVGARFDVVSADEVKVSPTPRSRGPWRVLEEGRQAGTSKSRRGRAPRTVGATRGKGTWSDAVDKMERRTPERFARELNTVLRRHLTGG